MSRAGPNDWLSATDVDNDGAASPGASIKKLNVNAAITGTSDATIVGPLGSRSAATSVSTTASTEDVARIGATNETAPATDTATSGLNGRLQRIAQRVTSLIALLPASLGRKASSASLAVVEAGKPYETVAAGQTDQVLGTTGAAGDYLSHIVIQPAAVGAGAVVVEDGGTPIFTFTSGTLPGLTPITVPFGIFSAGALSVTTGSDVAVIAVGNFT